jgi:hypothetical protein
MMKMMNLIGIQEIVLMKMIEHTKKLGFNLKIFTNFSRFNLKDIDNLIKD